MQVDQMQVSKYSIFCSAFISFPPSIYFSQQYSHYRQPFEDAVEAFKHIRDAHLKPLHTLKQSDAFPNNSIQEASVISKVKSTTETVEARESTGKRIGESLVTINKRMRVGNWLLINGFSLRLLSFITSNGLCMYYIHYRFEQDECLTKSATQSETAIKSI